MSYDISVVCPHCEETVYETSVTVNFYGLFKELDAAMPRSFEPLDKFSITSYYGADVDSFLFWLKSAREILEKQWNPYAHHLTGEANEKWVKQFGSDSPNPWNPTVYNATQVVNELIDGLSKYEGKKLNMKIY